MLTQKTKSTYNNIASKVVLSCLTFAKVYKRNYRKSSLTRQMKHCWCQSWPKALTWSSNIGTVHL